MTTQTLNAKPYNTTDNQPQDLGYQYSFAADQAQQAVQCVQEHGFAIVRNLIDEDLCQELQESVKQVCDPDGAMSEGESKTFLRFIEFSQPQLKLFDNTNWLNIQQTMHGGREDLTVHRTSCILRNPGAPGVAWHTDYSCASERSSSTNAVLNQGQAKSNLWFYLTGCRPSHGGLGIIPDSHRADWQPPEGFKFVRSGKSFNRIGADDETAYHKNDVPGFLPIVASGRDGLMFHARTYHVAFTNNEPTQRLSCNLVTRAGREPIDFPWPFPEEAKQLKQNVRDDLKPYFEHYTSIEVKQ